MSAKEPEGLSLLADPVNQFSIKLFHSLSTSESNSKQNVFLSPSSVSTALSMLLLGAKNESAKQLMKGLCFDSIAGQGQESIPTLFKELIESRIQKSESLALSNYVLIQKEGSENRVLNDFKSSINTLYSAKLDDVDFGSEGKKIQSKVNEWVNRSTKGLIGTILDKEPSIDTRLMLLNAIYFKGKWKKPFKKDNTTKQTFYNNGSEKVQTDLMVIYSKKLPYKESMIAGQKTQIVEFPYKEDGLSMIIVLPDKRNGLKKIISSKHFVTDVTNFIKSGSSKSQLLDVFLPKFKLQTDYDLNSKLIEMGISDIFAPTADLSGITGRKDLFVSLVKHKAVVKVDEEGTEAAAVTGGMCYATSIRKPPIKKTFRADHPFLFLIKDSRSAVVLFVGKVESLPAT